MSEAGKINRKERIERKEKNVIASEAKQSSVFPLRTFSGLLRHFVPRNDAFLTSDICFLISVF